MAKVRKKTVAAKESRGTKIEPRKWQRRAIGVVRSLAMDGSDRALIYACPGSGKTHGGLLIVKDLIDNVFPDAALVVLTPNLAIKSQWIDRAAQLGLDLRPVQSGEDLRQDSLGLRETGFILGYQQAVNMKHSLHEFCERRQVIIILDEIHHTEGPRGERDGNYWGHAVEFGCKPATFKLCTTGTPFREGRNPIALVRYQDGEVIAQVTYTYNEAIRDGVCRPIEFVMFDGPIAWQDGGKIISAQFADKLTKKLQRQRLRAAVSAEGDLPRAMLAEAHAKLLEIRQGGGVDRLAAGLIVACSTEHAEELAVELAAITGEAPLVVHSKIDDAQDIIDGFRDGDAMWMVGVNMLSEGVDIPRLRIGVYATNIRASLYFHQFCGRFMRVMESPRERAFVFMPADSELEAIALEIEKERCHALGEEYRPRLTRRGLRGGGQKNLVVESSSGEVASIAVGGNKYPIEFVRQHAERIAAFRRQRADRAQMSDGEILEIMIDLNHIAAPEMEAA